MTSRKQEIKINYCKHYWHSATIDQLQKINITSLSWMEEHGSGSLYPEYAVINIDCGEKNAHSSKYSSLKQNIIY